MCWPGNTYYHCSSEAWPRYSTWMFCVSCCQVNSRPSSCLFNFVLGGKLPASVSYLCISCVFLSIKCGRAWIRCTHSRIRSMWEREHTGIEQGWFAVVLWQVDGPFAYFSCTVIFYGSNLQLKIVHFVSILCWLELIETIYEFSSNFCMLAPSTVLKEKLLKMGVSGSLLQQSWAPNLWRDVSWIFL